MQSHSILSDIGLISENLICLTFCSESSCTPIQFTLDKPDYTFISHISDRQGRINVDPHAAND